MTWKGEAGRLILSGMSAVLVGVGLGRFAYAALLPGLIEAGWVNEAEGAYLGAANLAGYLLGALIASALSVRLGSVRVIRASFVLVCLSFAFCSLPTHVLWFFLWRFIAGVSGALLMVLGPSHVLAMLSPDQRKSGATLVFTGIGVGILLSATLVPVLVSHNLAAAWWAMALAAALPTLWSWRHWKSKGLHQAGQSPVRQASRARTTSRAALGAVLAAYGLDAIGFVPHTVFWVDFLAREAGYGATWANVYWVLFGFGAAFGAFLAGVVARALGWRTALAVALGLKMAAVALPVLGRDAWILAFSSFVVGALVPGTVALTSGYLAEIVGVEQHRRAWGWATVVFAVAQAVAGYVLAAMFIKAGSYLPLFAVAAGALLMAAGLVAISGLWLPPARSSSASKARG